MVKELLKSSRIIVRIYESIIWTSRKVKAIWNLKQNSWRMKRRGEKLSYKYDQLLTPQKRFLAIGFDDFRESDFNIVLPLLNKYGGRATFNRVCNSAIVNREDINRVRKILENGSEVGDHTWFHRCYIYTDPLFNGQDPQKVEGNQIPFPSNKQLREDHGEGKNAFGFDLIEAVNVKLPHLIVRDCKFENCWGQLTDEQCQMIREGFSIMHDADKLWVLDLLSNYYLGTKGNSKNSWNRKRGCYQGGIFSGCKTSANHEIWERIVQITRLFYKEQLGIDELLTWSWPGPGSFANPFKFKRDDEYYYDEEGGLPYNFTSKFYSSLYEKYRSWNDVLREYGYKITHDSVYPSKEDGKRKKIIAWQFMFNAFLSRKDALTYPTNYDIPYNSSGIDYQESFFKGNKSISAQMYDAQGHFYIFIESMRRNTANGLVQGALIDSENTFSQGVFLEALFEYCKSAGIEIVSKAEAFDICFNHRLVNGNLIYNSELTNTAMDFFKDSENVPLNPDGYLGDCYVEQDIDGKNILITQGTTNYIHYGIPYEQMEYELKVKGNGRIQLFYIRNKYDFSNSEQEQEKIDELVIKNEEWKRYLIRFEVNDSPLVDDSECEGLGEKIAGIRIEYSSGLYISDLCLQLSDHDEVGKYGNCNAEILSK